MQRLQNTRRSRGGRLVAPLLIVGAITGSVGRRAEAEEARGDARFLSTTFDCRDVDLPRLREQLGRAGLRIPFELEGTGTLRGRLCVPLAPLRSTRAYRFRGTLALPRVEAAGLVLNDVDTGIEYADGVLTLSDLRFAVPALGAVVACEAEFALAPQDDRSEPDPPEAVGRLTLRDVRWNGEPLSDSLTARVERTEDGFHVRNLAGVVAGGRLQCDIVLPLAKKGSPTARVSLTDACSTALCGPLGDVTGTVGGRIDLHVRGRFGEDFRLTGRVRAADVKVRAREAGSWRTRFRARVDPRSGGIRVDLSDVRGDFVGGRVEGSVKLRLGRRSDVDGTLEFSRLRVKPLLSGPARQQIGDGRVSGTARIHGRDLAALANAAVFVDADLGDGRTEATLADRLRLVLSAGTAASSTYDSGKLRGVYRDRVLHIDRLRLAGDAASIDVRGTMTAGGRLNLR